MNNKMNEAAQPSASPGWERAAIEKLLLANVRERRAARYWRLARTLLWIVFLGGLAWLAVGSQRLAATVATGPHTAVIHIRGEIGERSEASAQNVLPALRDALADPGAKALVLLINSPGGSPVQAGLINDEIKRLRTLHDKPIYAVVEDACASAAYYIAAAADEIYVDKASLVGSIGVLINGFGFVDTLDKLGVERRLLTAGGNKGFLDPFSPQAEEAKRHAQAMLDRIHEQFIDVVRQGRGERLQETPETFSGLVWTGAQAVELGLVDSLGSIDSVARDVIQAPRLIDYTNKESLPERLAKRFGSAVGQGAVAALRALPALR